MSGVVAKMDKASARIFEKLSQSEMSLMEAISLLGRREPSNEADVQWPLPLTAGQQELFTAGRLFRNSYAYNVPLALIFNGGRQGLDRLKAAFSATARRHPALRMRFREENGKVVQEPGSELPAWETIDLGSVDDVQLQDVVRRHAQRPFSLLKDIPVRCEVFLRGDQAPVVLFCFHHIIADGVSVGVFLQDIQTAYHKPDALPAGEDGLAAYVQEQAAYMAGEQAQKDRAHWLKVLEGSLPRIQFAGLGAGENDAEGTSEIFSLNKELTHLLRHKARYLRVSPFSLAVAAFALTLHRLYDQKDVLIGTPHSGRKRSEHNDVFGYLMNMIPIRACEDEAKTVKSWIREIHGDHLEAFDHDRLSISSLRDQLKKGAGPVFNVAFYYQNWAKTFSGDSQVGEDLFEPMEAIHQEGEFDLTLELLEDPESIRFYLKYRPKVLGPQEIQLFAQAYRFYLAELCRRSEDLPLSQIDTMPSDLLQAQIRRFSVMNEPFPRDKTVVDLIAQSVETFPQKTALVFADTQLSYSELWRKVARRREQLLEQGVEAGDFVALFCDRSPDMLVTMLAVMAAGAAYIPLDPDYPVERIRHMVGDASVSLVVCDDSLKARLPDGRFRVWCLEESGTESRTAMESAALPDGYAYVIYTSGSTGKPKGVAVGHRSLTNFLSSMAKKPGFSRDDYGLALTTVCFDISILELFLPLICGGTVEILTRKQARSGPALRRILESGRVSFVQATPTTWQMLRAAGWQGSHDLKILSGGEALPRDLARFLLQRGASLWNVFGPTETTIWSSTGRIQADAPVTVGQPIANTGVYVLDGALRHKPQGLVGELYIGGEGLAFGYLGDPAKTALSFLPDPFSGVPGSRMYRTGDMAKLLADGDIDILGRRDAQIKIRGFRVEIGEIESVLLEQEDVAEAAVVLRKDFGRDELVCFYMGSAPESELAQRLNPRLPEYMVPTRFYQVDNLPRTLNAKIDRKMLSRMDLDNPSRQEPNKAIVASSETAVSASRADYREFLLSEMRTLVAAMLNVTVDKVTATAQLSQLGFDSIRFTELSVALQEKLGVEVDPTAFFEVTHLKAVVAFLSETFDAHFQARYADRLAESRPSSSGSGSSRPTASSTRQRPRRDAATGSELVAVVGMAGRMPGADSLEDFYQKLESGESLIGEVPSDRWDWRDIHAGEDTPNFARWGAFMKDVDRFDAGFFGISPREAKFMDPQQRLFLQTVHQACEHAGYRPSDLSRGRTGVFVGVGSVDYAELLRFYQGPGDAAMSTGVSRNMIANRVSYVLNWHGPSEPVDAACAGALVALNRAVRAVAEGECDAAVAGGVGVMLQPHTAVMLGAGGMLSPSGACRPFDERADGYIRGEGVGAVLLKPLSQAEADGDTIYAVVRASGVNHGGRANALTAPNPNAQAELLADVYRRAGVDPATISYVETAANGTALGDPIEINSLKKAFAQLDTDGKQEPQAIALGNAKAQLGHMEAASGMGSLFKVLMAMARRRIVGQRVEKLNPYLKLDGTRFFIPETSLAWEPQIGADGKPQPLRAGVNSFGFGGVNAHLVLESYEQEPQTQVGGPRLIVLSATSEAQLKRYASEMAGFLTQRMEAGTAPDLADMAFTLQVGREPLRFRLAFTVETLAAARDGFLAYLEGRAFGDMLHGDVREHEGRLDLLLDDEDGDTFMRLLIEKQKWRKLAQLWIHGVEIPWTELYDQPRRISLPTYPFEKQRHWVIDGIPSFAPGQVSVRTFTPTAAPTAPVTENPVAARPEAAPSQDQGLAALTAWVAECLGMAVDTVDVDADFSDYGFDSYIGLQVLQKVEARYGLQLNSEVLYQYPNVRALAAYIEQVGNPVAEAETIASTQTEVEPAAPTAPAEIEVQPAPRPAPEPVAAAPTAETRSAQARFPSFPPSPLSEAQKALWFINLMDPDTYAYNLPVAFWIKSEVNIETMKRVVDQLVARHAALRTVFSIVDGEPRRVPAAEDAVYFHHLDWSHLSLDACLRRLDETALKPFDLERGPLFRFYAVKAAENRHAILIVVHHIIFDGSSFVPLMNEMAALYEAEVKGNPLNLPALDAEYSDFVERSQTMLAGERGERLWSYWSEKMAGEIPALSLHTDFPRPSVAGSKGEVFSYALEPEVLGKLKKMAAAHRTSFFTILLAAYQVLLHRYTGQTDIIVGTPLAGRNRPEYRNLIGYFINMVPLRADLSGNPRFTNFLREVRETVLGALDHGDYPFALMTKKLGQDQDRSRHPLFQACFILQNWVAGLNTDIAGMETESIDSIHETGGFDLTLEIFDTPEGSTAFFKYNPELFKQTRIRRMADQFATLLRAVVEKPDQKIGYLDILSASEKKQLIEGFNQTQANFPLEKAMHTFFEENAAKNPDAPAVTFRDQTLTFKELNEKANALAHYLRSHGVGPERLIGVFLDRSVELSIAILGVLKTGAAYVPLDPNYPKDRLAYILEDAAAPFVITRQGLLEKLPEHGAQNLCLDLEQETLAKQPVGNLGVRVDPQNLVYVIYTSGSTGKPKGVLTTHIALVNYCLGFVDHYKLKAEDHVLQFASISFDTAAEEIFPTWIAGCRLIFRTDESIADFKVFVDFLNQNQISILDLPTAFWHQWVADMEGEEQDLPEVLRLVIVGGEEASADRLAAWRRKFGDRVLWSNTYGPTETTIAATLYEPAVEGE